MDLRRGSYQRTYKGHGLPGNKFLMLIKKDSNGDHSITQRNIVLPQSIVLPQRNVVPSSVF